MKINIYGFSNLGIDLYEQAQKHGYEVRVWSHSKQDQLFIDPNIIINTIGGCAGGQFVEDPPNELWKQNIEMNERFVLLNPYARIIAFSSNSSLEAYRTPYGAIKLAMQQIPGLHTICVGNLYGKHKPDLTFPGKILKNPPKDLPTNPIVPMPTDFIAERFFTHYFNGKNQNYLRPTGQTSVHGWGEVILERPIEQRPMTIDRNTSKVLLGRGPDWKYLWEMRKHWYK